MNKSLLVKLFGFPATLVHGDTLVLDRWRWLKKRLPVTCNEEQLLDVGCGTGAFSIGAAKRGYKTLGLSWDERNQGMAAERARLSGADDARFDVLDVRKLDTRRDLVGQFEYIICLETIEHILDDAKLLEDMSHCLKPGGRLLLTTPNYFYRAITRMDNGPFMKEETGWHVRRGYSPEMLLELCANANLKCESISYCSGVVSQKVTWLLRVLSRLNHLFAWMIILPLRPFPILLDWLATPMLNWPRYSICLEAYKPRIHDRSSSA
jgi:2-polyprenyl-3-methyl-5-hydroxy-6-metoxy-1,4-benzoquinol methylase